MKTDMAAARVGGTLIEDGPIGAQGLPARTEG